ncbi:MAG: hypothetical protein ACK4PI_05360 [Tepidisphaerales bacterium]
MDTLQVLQSVWGLERFIGIAVLVAIIVLEIAIIALLCSSKHWCQGGDLAAVFLLIVTAHPIAQLIRGSTDGCGCGLPSFFTDPRLAQAYAIVRHLTLVGLWWLLSERMQGRNVSALRAD